MRGALITLPRRRVIAAVVLLALTLVTAAASGYAVWRITDSAPHLAKPDRTPQTRTGHLERAPTVTSTPRVIRLTPDQSFANVARHTSTALSSPGEREPTELPVPPRTSATADPTPSSTSAAPELVSDGSFEESPSAWYVEDGAAPAVSDTAADGSMVLRIPSGGGYADQRLGANSGETYVLTGNGRLTAEGDLGTLGVVYRDGSGVRLAALEPPPIVFTGTMFSEERLIFTIPAGVVEVMVYAYKEPGPGLFEADAISVRLVVEQ